MRGTVVCGVVDSPNGRGAVELAAALAERLRLRLVLVHVIADVPADAVATLTGRGRQSEAEAFLRAAADEAGNGTEARVVLGDRAERLAQVAAEEGADMIVLGSQRAGLGRRNLRCTLARELEATTPVPVLVAPPATRPRSDRRLEAAAVAETH